MLSCGLFGTCTFVDWRRCQCSQVVFLSLLWYQFEYAVMLLLWAATAAVCIGFHRHIYSLNMFSLCGAFAETCFSRENCFFQTWHGCFSLGKASVPFHPSQDRSFSVYKSGSGFKLVITFSWSWVCGRGRTMAVTILQIHWINQNVQITGGVIAMTRLVVKKITSFLNGLLIFRP